METYNLQAIILKRQPFREVDSRVVVFSLEKGKLDLVARGTKKTSSKLSAHIEPLNLTRIMAVRGKRFDYLGGVASDNCFLNIKNNLEKQEYIGQSLNIFNRLIKEEEGSDSKELFYLLRNYLLFIDSHNTDNALFYYYFILKLLNLLGYKPELDSCVACGKEVKLDNVYFSYQKGGVVCAKCKQVSDLSVSNKCINILKSVIDNDFNQINTLEVDDSARVEIIKHVDNFYKYNF